MPAAARLRPMQARDVHQPHRVATSLELLFDLVTVIAVASAAAGLHHAIAGGGTPLTESSGSPWRFLASGGPG